MGRLFGTNGVRGIVGETMTPDLALRLGKAVGTWKAPGDIMAVGNDARASAAMLKAAFCAGLHSTGVSTIDVGICPSPGIQLFVRDQALAAGAIITASHNPAEFNGIKLIAPDGTETSQDEESAVESIYFDETYRQVSWSDVGTSLPPADAADAYLAAVLAQVDVESIRNAGLKVVLDPGGGAGCVTGPRLMDALGVECIRLSCDLDGAFRDRPSEPTRENAKACIETVQRQGADLGILQDGDADRAVFIDETGEYMEGDIALALTALHELPRHDPPRIMCTGISSSTTIEDICKRIGAELHWTVVGSPIVARTMIKTGAQFGGEDNGGLMFARHIHCRDGLMAAAFMLELLASTGKPMSELTAEIPRYALVKDKIRVPEAAKASLMADMVQQVRALPDVTRVDDRDGVKVYLETGWVLVRPSGTEPIFRVQAEAKTQEQAAQSVARFKDLLQATLTAGA